MQPTNTQHATRNTFHVLCAAAAAVFALVLLWGPWGRAEGRPVAWEASTAWAAPVITGTVTWKGTEQPVSGVAVVLRDARSNTAVETATTDAAGVYLLSPGVGDWLVDVPSTATYWGYAQTMTALPHSEYHFDFGITPRPPEAATTGTGQGGAPAGAAGGTTPPTTPIPQSAIRNPQSGLPPAGHPADPILPLIGAGLLIGAGALLRRRRTLEGTRA